MSAEDDDVVDLSSPASSSSTSSMSGEFSCAVCGRPCTKYLYYGARACLGCRAFFRRARAADRFATFVCLSGSGRCVVDGGGGDGGSGERRKMCPFCRHNRCLEVGMNPAWMLSDEDREERRKRRKRLGQNLRQTQQTGEERSHNTTPKWSCSPTSTKVNVTKLPLTTAPNLVFTAEELLQVQRIVSTTNDIYLEAFTSNMLFHRLTARSILEMSLFGTKHGSFVIDGLEALKKKTVATLCESFQDFSPINPADRRRLLENNFPVLFTVLVANYFHPDGFNLIVSRILGRLKKRQSENHIFEDIAGSLEVLEISGITLALNYEQVFVSPWLPNPAEEARHAMLFDKIRLWGRGDHPDRVRDHAMMVMLYLILILDPAACDHLTDRATVERVHDRYVTLLCRYLQWNYGPSQATNWLGGGVAMVALAKEAQHIMERRARVALEETAIVNNMIRTLEQGDQAATATLQEL